MSFMKPEVFEGEYYRVETSDSTWIVPASDVGSVETYSDLRDYVQGTIEAPDAVATLHKGWLCRLSAPGYLDCTEWDAFETEQEAREHLRDWYDICPDCGEDMGDADECPECSGDCDEDCEGCDDCEPQCGTCGERHPVVIHDDGCEYYYGTNNAGFDSGECTCGDNVVGREGYMSVDVACIDDASA